MALVKGRLVKETTMAYLVEVEDAQSGYVKEEWLPRSQLSYVLKSVDGRIAMEVPSWLLREKCIASDE